MAGMVATPTAPNAASSTDSLKDLYAHFIGGRRVRPDGTPDLVRSNPAATDQVLGNLRSADPAPGATPARPAHGAGPKGRNTPAPARGKVLVEAARLMDKYREELARLISLEEGKALKDSRA